MGRPPRGRPLRARAEPRNARAARQPAAATAAALARAHSLLKHASNKRSARARDLQKLQAPERRGTRHPYRSRATHSVRLEVSPARRVLYASDKRLRSKTSPRWVRPETCKHSLQGAVATRCRVDDDGTPPLRHLVQAFQKRLPVSNVRASLVRVDDDFSRRRRGRRRRVTRARATALYR